MQKQLPHSSTPDGRTTTSGSDPDSRSPNPSRSDIPLTPPLLCIPDVDNESNSNPKEALVNADDDSKSMDMVVSTLDPKKEANVNTSPPVDTPDAINHDTFKESAITDDTHQMDVLHIHEHNLLVQETEINSPSNGVDWNSWITHDDPDDHLDNDTDNCVESTAKGCISSVTAPSDSLEWEENHPS